MKKVRIGKVRKTMLEQKEQKVLSEHNMSNSYVKTYQINQIVSLLNSTP